MVHQQEINTNTYINFIEQVFLIFQYAISQCTYKVVGPQTIGPAVKNKLIVKKNVKIKKAKSNRQVRYKISKSHLSTIKLNTDNLKKF